MGLDIAHLTYWALGWKVLSHFRPAMRQLLIKGTLLCKAIYHHTLKAGDLKRQGLRTASGTCDLYGPTGLRT